jgi:hypothetical protein
MGRSFGDGFDWGVGEGLRVWVGDWEKVGGRGFPLPMGKL